MSRIRSEHCDMVGLYGCPDDGKDDGHGEYLPRTGGPGVQGHTDTPEECIAIAQKLNYTWVQWSAECYDPSEPDGILAVCKADADPTKCAHCKGIISGTLDTPPCKIHTVVLYIYIWRVLFGERCSYTGTPPCKIHTVHTWHVLQGGRIYAGSRPAGSRAGDGVQDEMPGGALRLPRQQLLRDEPVCRRVRVARTVVLLRGGNGTLLPEMWVRVSNRHG